MTTIPIPVLSAAVKILNKASILCDSYHVRRSSIGSSSTTRRWNIARETISLVKSSIQFNYGYRFRLKSRYCRSPRDKIISAQYVHQLISKSILLNEEQNKRMNKKFNDRSGSAVSEMFSEMYNSMFLVYRSHLVIFQIKAFHGILSTHENTNDNVSHGH